MMMQLSEAQPVSCAWAASFSGNNAGAVKSSAVDAMGNVYTAGYFSGTVDFDPGPSSFLMSSAGMQDIFVCKLNVNGQFLWAKRIGGAGNEFASSVVWDADGYVYLCGYFGGTVDFNPGTEINELISASTGSQDMYVLKLDDSGNFIWAKGFGGSGYYDTLGNLYDAQCYAACILRDSTCGLYFCGHFQGDIDFDPGTQVVNLNTSGGTGAFICKLDTGGHYIWARQIGGLGFDCECDGLCLGENNSLYLTGTFSGTVDFDSGPGFYPLTTSAYSAAFLLKYTTSGQYVWSRKLDGLGNADQACGLTLACNVQQEIIVGGKFKGSLNWIGASNSILSKGGYDAWFCRYDSNGNGVWLNSIGGNGHDYCYHLTTDVNDNIWITGAYHNEVDFDPGPNESILSSNNGTADIYILRLSSTGEYLNACSLGGNGNDAGNDVIQSSQSGIVLSGYFSGLMNYSGAQLSSASGMNAFILRIESTPIVLDVNAMSLHGRCTEQGNEIYLMWMPKSMTDSLEIQHSADAKKFISLGCLTALPNTGTIGSDTFMDIYPNIGKNYYRLLVHQEGGLSTHSDVISLQRSEEPLCWDVFPNPAQEILNIDTKFILTGGILVLYDQEGRLLQAKYPKGGSFYTMDLSPFQTGEYVLKYLPDMKDERNMNAWSTSVSKYKIVKE